MSAVVTQALTLGAVAKHYGIPLWKVRRVFERRLLPEPGRIGHYRVVASENLPELDRVRPQPARALPPRGPAPVPPGSPSQR
jgi:hypothetical protein